MQAILMTLVLALPGDCPTCRGTAPHATARGTRPAPVALACPNYTPPVRWFCKPCAGCAGTNCLSTQQPYFGSAPYNYRVQFDYPWSQEPGYSFVQTKELLGEAYLEEVAPPAAPQGPLPDAPPGAIYGAARPSHRTLKLR